jgi:hypothetical protein
MREGVWAGYCCVRCGHVLVVIDILGIGVFAGGLIVVSEPGVRLMVSLLASMIFDVTCWG